MSRDHEDEQTIPEPEPELEQEEVLIPVEQETVPFYGRELVAVRLADGRICAVLRWLCEGMHLSDKAQVRRIRRKTALADGLVPVRVATEGGPQSMPALTLEVLPGWLFGIDEDRVKPAARLDVIVFQRECVQVLAAHFANKPRPALGAPTLPVPASSPVSVPVAVPADHLPEPAPPAATAGRAEWRDWRQAMRIWLDWQDELDAWREQSEQRHEALERRQDALESRMEGVEELSRLFVEVTERLGPQTLTSEHQATVKAMVKRLNELSGIAYATTYSDLNAAFHVAKYSDIADAHWPEVVSWFQQRMDAVENRYRSR